MRTPKAPLLASMVLLVSTTALACPVCYNPREDSRLAFLWSAIAMTVLPLAMVGGLIYWLWRRANSDER